MDALYIVHPLLYFTCACAITVNDVLWMYQRSRLKATGMIAYVLSVIAYVNLLMSYLILRVIVAGAVVFGFTKSQKVHFKFHVNSTFIHLFIF